MIGLGCILLYVLYHYFIFCVFYYLFIPMRHAAHTGATWFCSLRFVAADVVRNIAKCHTKFRGEPSLSQVFRSSWPVLCGYLALSSNGLAECIKRYQKCSDSHENWSQKDPQIHSFKINVWGAFEASGAWLGSMDIKKWVPRMVFETLWSPLCRFGIPFGRPRDFEGASKIAFVDIEVNKMRQNGVLDPVLKKHEFTLVFNEMPEM